MRAIFEMLSFCFLTLLSMFGIFHHTTIQSVQSLTDISSLGTCAKRLAGLKTKRKALLKHLDQKRGKKKKKEKTLGPSVAAEFCCPWNTFAVCAKWSLKVSMKK